MKITKTIIVEAVLIIIALVLGVMWMQNPTGNFEPYIVTITSFLGLIEIIRRLAKKKDKKEHQLSKITVKEIVNEINGSPPFQKEAVANRYNGLIVEWSGYLHSVEKLSVKKNIVKVNLRTEEEFNIGCYYIWFEISVNDFPDIQHINSGTPIKIKGEIIRSSGGGLCSTLRPISVKVKA